MKRLAVALAAGILSLGLIGCDDELSRSCYSINNCSGGSGVSCDNAPTTCWATYQECRNSSQCD